jgi:secondary thiamine-phosphate synthase enzyme
MSRRSTVTLREQPVTAATSASGALAVHSETFAVETGERVQVVDLTERVMAIVARLGVKEGIVHVCSLHTTCAVFINEFQVALVADIKTFIQRVVAHDADWLHNDPAHSDCDRMNADAHLRAMLFEHSVSLQVSGGEVVLGQWQRILMAELDGPRTRTFRLMVMGIG